MVSVIDDQAEGTMVLQTWFSMALHLCVRVVELAVSNGNWKNVLKVNQVSIVRKGENVREMRVKFRNYKHMKPGETAVRSITATYEKW